LLSLFWLPFDLNFPSCLEKAGDAVNPRAQMANSAGNVHRKVNFFMVCPLIFVIAVATRSNIEQQACHACKSDANRHREVFSRKSTGSAAKYYSGRVRCFCAGYADNSRRLTVKLHERQKGIGRVRLDYSLVRSQTSSLINLQKFSSVLRHLLKPELVVCLE
jgi:hypothetical protein